MADECVSNKRIQTENCELSLNPKKILLFSGKRKSGKDFITDELFNRLSSEECVIIKLSGPIKSHWAKLENLDSEQLFGNGEYKEAYRLEMTKWGENMRNKDYGYFCRAAIDMYNANSKPVWIISDARRKTDLKWFKENYANKCKTIRISSCAEIRKNRGWKFCEGIDDSETECDLDDVTDWDLEISNDGQDIELILKKIIDILK